MGEKQQGTMLSAAKWATASNVAQEVLAGLLTFILAAFLSPSEFGAVAIAYIYMAFIELVLGFGFTAAIIQRGNLTGTHLSSIFWLNQVSGLVLTVSAVALSGWWARLNDMPELRSILLVLSILIPVQGLSVVQVAILQRTMAFKTLAIRNTAGTFCGGVVGVVLAIMGCGVWALVTQYLVRGFVSLALLWGISDWRPKFLFKISAIKDLTPFSLKTLFGQFGTFLQQQADALIVGIFMGPAAIGLYRLADRLVEMNLKFVPRALQVVSLPHFSKLKGDPAALNRSVLFSAQLSTLFMFPAMAFLFFASPVILRAIGLQWGEAAPVLRLFAIVGALKSVLMLLGPLLQASNRPGVNSMNVWLLALVNALCVGVVASNRFGEGRSDIWFVAVARTLAFSCLFAPLVLLQAHWATGLSIVSLARAVLPSALNGAMIAGVQFVLTQTGLTSSRESVFLDLLLRAIITIAMWLCFLKLFDPIGWQIIQQGGLLLQRLYPFRRRSGEPDSKIITPLANPKP